MPEFMSRRPRRSPVPRNLSATVLAITNPEFPEGNYVFMDRLNQGGGQQGASHVGCMLVRRSLRAAVASLKPQSTRYRSIEYLKEHVLSVPQHVSDNGRVLNSHVRGMKIMHNDGPSELLAKYGFRLVTLSLSDTKKYGIFPLKIDLILIEAVELAKDKNSKKVNITIHTEEGTYNLSSEQISALLT